MNNTRATKSNKFDNKLCLLDCDIVQAISFKIQLTKNSFRKTKCPTIS